MITKAQNRSASALESTPARVMRDSPFHRVLPWIESAQAYYERNSVLVFGMVMGIFAFWAFFASRAKPLWLDERLGLVAAQAPSTGELLSALKSGIDFNPPLYHLLERLSIGLLGYSLVAIRLPAFLGMLAFFFCLYRFVSKRLAPSYGILAVLIVLCTPVHQYAWDARPYGVILGLTGVAMLAYQKRIECDAAWTALAVYSIAMGALVATHYYAFLIVGAFVCAELARTISRRKVDWFLLGGTILAPALILFLLRPIIEGQRSSLGQYHSPGSLTSFIYGYELYTVKTWMLCLGLIVLAISAHFKKIHPDREDDGVSPTPAFSGSELTLASALLLLPLIGSGVAVVLHAYVARYFLAAAAGYGVLVPYAITHLAKRCMAATLLLSLTIGAGIGLQCLSAFASGRAPSAFSNLKRLQGATIPIAFEGEGDFLEALESNPDMRQRFYYVSEPALALKLSGTDTEDRIMKAVAARRPVQVTTLDGLFRSTDQVLVVPSSVGWLLKCLSGMNAEMRLVRLEGYSNRQLPVPSLLQVRLPVRDGKRRSWCEGDPSASSAGTSPLE